MKRHRRRWTALAAFGIMIAFAGLPLLTSGASTAEAAPARQASPCVVDTRQVVSPPVLLLGEDVEIQLSVRATCPFTEPLHIVFVLDASGSMVGAPSAEMKQATKEFIRRLDLARNPATKVGVVEFSDTARTLCQLTGDEARAIGCVNKVGVDGGSALDAGIHQGLTVLRKGRSRASTRNEVLFVFSNGGEDCAASKQAAGRAKSQGVLVVAVCVGLGCDPECMRYVATSARFFFEARSASQLAGFLGAIHAQVLDVTLRALEVTDVLPENLEYIPGSSVPPADVSPDQKTLQWWLYFVPRDGVTFTFRAKPLEAGSHRTHVQAVAEYRDSRNQQGVALFPVRLVSVMQFILPPRPIAP